MKLVTEATEKFTNWEAIPYAADLRCPDCGESGFWGKGKLDKPKFLAFIPHLKKWVFPHGDS